MKDPPMSSSYIITAMSSFHLKAGYTIQNSIGNSLTVHINPCRIHFDHQ